VYCRPYAEDIFSVSHKSRIVQNFLNRESYFLLKTIWESTRKNNSFWINPWESSQIAANKGLQMNLATKLGLKVPRTLMTSSSNEAKAFIRHAKARDKRVVIKTLSGLKNQERNERGGAFVTVISVDKLGTQNYPLLLQEYVEKQYELRITVVGDKVFPCKITSQESPREITKIDWRVYDFENVKFLPTELPTSISQKCIQLVKLLGLKYSAIDIIYEPDGQYRFLEINPNGLWLWIEELARLPITDAIADLLIRNL
ncbi:MAG: hypothetical protein GF387_01455, partial [Candidatus Portnoybacteria bacterium]|nr:hypothetical protein [Candidatus Portnoybacteria bacterium]